MAFLEKNPTTNQQGYYRTNDPAGGFFGPFDHAVMAADAAIEAGHDDFCIVEWAAKEAVSEQLNVDMPDN